MTSTLTFTIVPGREYAVSSPGVVQVYYNGMLVTGRFIGLAGVNTIVVTSSTTLTTTAVVTEYLRNLYDPTDSQGGTWAYRSDINRWTTEYAFRPEWMGSVGNRLVSFRNGIPYIHDGAFNTFYGQATDTVIAAVHNDAGNTVKAYNSIAVEGDQPDRVHFRTEKPFIQSTDLIPADFDDKEGVKYAPILRDRLSPNTSGGYEVALSKGDKLRGENSKYMVVFSLPTSLKGLKFVNINSTPSRGQTV